MTQFGRTISSRVVSNEYVPTRPTYVKLALKHRQHMDRESSCVIIKMLYSQCSLQYLVGVVRL